jgi:hypothetical protein
LFAVFGCFESSDYKNNIFLMRSQLERAINLAAVTGDKIIIVDKENDRSLAVMNLDEYEKLLNGESKRNKKIDNLTEEDLLDKINHDIISWKDAREEKFFLENSETDSEDDLDDEEGDDLDFSGALSDGDEDDDVFPDFIAPSCDSEGNIISEEADSESEKKSAEESAAEEENLYYYNEPERAETEKEPSGFTSIKDELKKNRKTWEIPEEAKKRAADEANF